MAPAQSIILPSEILLLVLEHAINPWKETMGFVLRNTKWSIGRTGTATVYPLEALHLARATPAFAAHAHRIVTKVFNDFKADLELSDKMITAARQVIETKSLKAYEIAQAQYNAGTIGKYERDNLIRINTHEAAMNNDKLVDHLVVHARKEEWTKKCEDVMRAFDEVHEGWLKRGGKELYVDGMDVAMRMVMAEGLRKDLEKPNRFRG